MENNLYSLEHADFVYVSLQLCQMSTNSVHTTVIKIYCPENKTPFQKPSLKYRSARPDL